MNFYINQTFNGIYPPEAAVWCNTNNAFIEKTMDGYIIKAVSAPTSEELKQFIRNERNMLLNEVTWMIERHKEEKELPKVTTLSDLQYNELLNYRQALRDITDQPGFPWKGNINLVPWPKKPSFIK